MNIGDSIYIVSSFSSEANIEAKITGKYNRDFFFVKTNSGLTWMIHRKNLKLRNNTYEKR